MKKQIKYISAGMLAGMLLCGGELQASNRMTEMYVCPADAIQKDNRPEISNRLFRSNAVEKEILRVQKLLKNAATLPKTARTTQKTAQTNNNTKEVCIERYVPFFLSVFFGLTLDKGGRL